ncbi:LysM and putative peptidoglycan-binding domain-containing protein 2 [Madurella mycetomatis]|uniref:LysM and putative peptidoglycan-binding domain-containing protein 2 n=1 Tax=Madurella mycetomatis TaxID=100816 RepID=A0A175VW29_9PEZI|nr:LysM and putative peptidoglycan-binding domain-containing protein 2 [Madurella mycetomatis]
MIPSRHDSSSTHLQATRDPDATSVRPRNRRLLSAQGDAGSSSALSSPSRSPSRGATPIPAEHIGSVTGRNNSGTEVARSPARARSSGPGRGFLDSSWAPSWASVQDLASSLLTSGGSVLSGESRQPRSRDASKARKPSRQGSFRGGHGTSNWGPEPPNEGRPRAAEIAAGSLAKREATLKAMRTARVLESHEGVNGGLDVMGKFKKRNSDEIARETPQTQETEEYLAYIHHVQPTDTYAGIVLKYRCREDAFRKANGLWSRDNIQVRKWLAIPVDACEVKGRPCEPPANPSSTVDLLCRTPDTSDPFGRDNQSTQDGFFTSPTNGHALVQTRSNDGDRPWTHVRWVSIDSHPHPVEVGRLPRKAMGYFPPRRKKSMHTTSTLSTPRGSVDLPGVTRSEAALESPRSNSSRQASILANRPTRSPSHGDASTASASRSRLSSSGASDDARPAWMRRPGGVGSLGRHVRAPGPERDYFNTWTSKHLPGLNIDFLPSMSIMGSESARFGFAKPDDSAPAAIVESSFEEGRDATSANRQGSGLDKAASTIEAWLRGAFERAKQGPITPVLGPRRRSFYASPPPGDLIELADTNSDDGRHDSALSDAGGLLEPVSTTAAVGVPGGSSGRNFGQGPTARGRGVAASPAAHKKAD